MANLDTLSFSKILQFFSDLLGALALVILRLLEDPAVVNQDSNAQSDR